MNKLIGVIILTTMFTGCAVAPRNPLIYEDANVAIYRICAYGAGIVPVCRDQVVQKKQTADLNAEVKINQPPKNTTVKKENVDTPANGM